MVLCDGGVFHEDCRVWVAADKGLSVDERDSLIADLEVVVLLVGSFQGIQHVVIHQMIILFQKAYIHGLFNRCFSCIVL